MAIIINHAYSYIATLTGGPCVGSVPSEHWNVGH